LRRGFLLIPLALALAWFAPSPTTRAVIPAPDGGYPNFNTAEGDDALYSNTTGTDNAANGAYTLFSNLDGSFNTANGVAALFYNTTGYNNTADGSLALAYNTTGFYNTANGVQALYNNTTGTVVSSTGYKEAIKPMDKASEAILALKPVTFRYKKELDPEGIPQFGLVAEQVEKVNPDLVARDEQGKPYTVRYEAVNAMLLNEFLKQHRTVEELKKDFQATIAQQQNEIKALAATVKEQAAQIQKVSAQVELSKPAPQTVLNNQ